ncbi:hypothetical protein QTN25_010694 [Entamoeba marina]
MQQQKPIQYSENDIRDYLINYEDKPSLTQFAFNKLDYNGENGVNDEDIANWLAQHVTSVEHPRAQGQTRNIITHSRSLDEARQRPHQYIQPQLTTIVKPLQRQPTHWRLDLARHQAPTRSDKEAEYVNALNNKDRWMTQASQTLQGLGYDPQTLQPINLNTSSQ